MSKKIPAKPFSNYQEGKLQNPAKAQNQEPNAKSIAGTPKPKASAPTPPSQVTPSQNRTGLLFILVVVIALASAYIGFAVSDQFAEPVNRVVIAETELTYETGDVGRLTARVDGEFDRYDLFWTSSNLDIVYVDNGGNLAALSPGRAIITASVGNGTVKDTIIINVDAAETPDG